jgi:hypothetical protein
MRIEPEQDQELSCSLSSLGLPNFVAHFGKF